MIRDFAWHEQQRITPADRDAGHAVDTDERVVYLDHGGPLRYDALLVATGGWANKLHVPGAAGTEYIYNFVTLDDTRRSDRARAGEQRAPSHPAAASSPMR